MTRPREHANGEGSVYKQTNSRTLKDGTVKSWTRWIAVVTYPDGKRKKAVRTTRQEARAALAKLVAERESGRPREADRQTVGEYLTWWFDHSLRCRATTRASYEGIIRLYLQPELGRIALTKLTPQHVDQMLTKIEKTRSPSRARAVRAVLRQALETAVRQRMLAYNAAALTAVPEVEERETPELTIDEIFTLLDAVSRDRLAALYITAMAMGLRQGELLGLAWNDVDRETGRLTVRKQMQPIVDEATGKTTLTRVAPKSKAGRRLLPMPAIVAEAMREHRERQIKQRWRWGTRWQENGLVFTTRFGGPIERGNLRHGWYGLLKRNNLPHIRFHDLRHIYATLLEELGVHPFTMKSLMGHTREAMTQRYSKTLEHSKVQAAAQIDALLRGRGAGEGATEGAAESE